MEICRYVRTYSLLGLWVIAVSLVVSRYQPNSSPQPTYYASDTIFSVSVVLGVMLVELVVLYLLLKPWKRPTSAWGSLGAFVLFTPWAMLSSIFAMHGSNAVILHVFWLWVVEIFLVIYILFSVVSSYWKSSTFPPKD